MSGHRVLAGLSLNSDCNVPYNRLQRCYERREEVIDAFFDLADAIITVRSPIPQELGHLLVGHPPSIDGYHITNPRGPLACYLTCLPAGLLVLVSVRLTVLPTSWRVAGRRFFDPAGRPGPGLEGFGALAGTGSIWRRFR
jgi:hypothetical protein